MNRKFLAMVLSLVMLVCTLCASLSLETFATDGAQTGELQGVSQPMLLEDGRYYVELPYVSNPLYDGVISERASKLYSSGEGSFSYENEKLGASHTTFEQAGAEMRAALVNRTKTITVDFYSTSTDYQGMADRIVEEAMKHTGVGTEGDYLAWHYIGYGGGVSFKGNQYRFTFNFEYYTTKAQEDALTAAIEDLKTDLSLSGKTDYEKVKAIYDYITENIEYDYDNLEDDDYTLKYSAYAALMNKTAVCQGYASLLYRLLLESGIDCRVIAGYANGGAHGWNIVELNDKYYLADSTWDAGNLHRPYGYQYFLKCENNFIGHIPDDKYATAEFKAAYPIGLVDFIDTLKGDFEIVNGVLKSYNGEDSVVIIPDGVTTIGNTAFDSMHHIKKIVVPNSVKVIEYNAFNACTGLEEIVLPEGIKTIERSAFFMCESLKEVVIPKSCESIEMMQFLYCSSLEKVTFLSRDTIIEGTDITIPASATIYGYVGSPAQAYAKKYGREFVALVTSGDLTDDGMVTRDDAIYLLYHSIFGEESYPLSQECDYNGDGYITKADAIYLLYNSIFGEESYPLE